MSESSGYYTLKWNEAKERNPRALRNASVDLCHLCGAVVNAMGGTRKAVICKPCGDVVVDGQCRGAINWEDDGE